MTTEPGLGLIRYSIANHLYRGTRTIQTRLLHMLFVRRKWTIVKEIDSGT